MTRPARDYRLGQSPGGGRHPSNPRFHSADSAKGGRPRRPNRQLWLYTDSASSYRALKGCVHDYVNHTKKEYARGDARESGGVSVLLAQAVLAGVSCGEQTNLPGYVGFFQFLRNFYQRTAFEQAEMILYAALDPTIASKARQGDFVRYLDHFDLLQSPIN